MSWEASEDAGRIGAEILRLLDELTGTVTDQLRVAVPELPDDSLTIQLRSSVRGALEVSGRMLVNRESVRHATASPEMSDFARLTARRSLPLSTLVMLYHRSHNIVEQSLLTIVSSLFGDRPAPDLLDTLTGMRDWSNRYILTMQEQVADSYRDEVERLHTPGDAGRLALVQSVLDGVDAPADIDGHRLAGRHQAVIIWGTDSGTTAAAALGTAGRELARRLGSSAAPLLVYPSADELWMWCAPDGDVTSLEELDGLSAAVGPVSTGTTGFILSHRQALSVQRLHRLVGSGTGIWSTDDAGLIGAAAFADRPDTARDIVTVTLRALATDDEYSNVLRETARSFLRRGTSGAAGEMIAHRNTVTYRLNKFREALGEDALNSPDVRLALELTHWFGPLVLRN